MLVQAVCEKIKAKVLKWGDRKAVQVMIITNDKLDKKGFIFWGCKQFHFLFSLIYPPSHILDLFFSVGIIEIALAKRLKIGPGKPPPLSPEPIKSCVQ